MKQVSSNWWVISYENNRCALSTFIISFSSMDYSCDDEVKFEELFRDEDRDLINKIKMCKHHLDEGWKSICSLCEYGKNMWE